MQRKQEFDSSKYQQNFLQQEEGNLHVNQPKQKITLKQGFSKSELEEVQDSLYGKIVEFDLYDNHSKVVVKQVIQFISEQNSHWKGIEMSFTYQQDYFEEEDLFNLSKAISTFKNLESLTLTFGSLIVSLLHAEDSPNARREWQKANCRYAFSQQSMKQLLASIKTSISKSPNLKVFKFDLQPQFKETSEKILEGLYQVNQQLNNCKNLQFYEISMNHCDIDGNYYDQNVVRAKKDPISLFFLSFEMLETKIQLSKFTLNICDFILKDSQFKLFTQIFFSLQSKPLLTNISVDHSAQQILTSETANFIAVRITSFLISNKNTLVTFYLSLNSYHTSEYDLDQIIFLLPFIYQCNQLERLSLRLYGWTCRKNSQQKRFFTALVGIELLRKLSFFHFQIFDLLDFNQEFNIKKGFEELLQILAERDLMKKQCQISKVIQQKYNLTRLEQASSIVEEYYDLIKKEMYRYS